jgi:hypothetical protein
MDLPIKNVTVLRLIYSVAVIIAAVVLVRLGRQLIGRYVDDPERRYRLSTYVGRGSALLGVLLIVLIWSPGLHSISTVLTVIGAGFAIALRETLLSFAGWMQIATRSPYSQGDRVEVGDVKGDVVDIRSSTPPSWRSADGLGRIRARDASCTCPTATFFSIRSTTTHARLRLRLERAGADRDVSQRLGRCPRDHPRDGERQSGKRRRESLARAAPPIARVPGALQCSHALRLRPARTERRAPDASLSVQGAQAARHRTLEAKEHGEIEMAYPTPSIQTYGDPPFGPASPREEGERRAGSNGSPFESRTPPQS